jgi:hypothetical protein
MLQGDVRQADVVSNSLAIAGSRVQFSIFRAAMRTVEFLSLRPPNGLIRSNNSSFFGPEPCTRLDPSY